MKLTTENHPFHIGGEQMLERSCWFGPNLVTFLITTEETNGSFSLIRTTIRQGFQPPLHIHSREDESAYILDGEVLYQAGEHEFYAKPGDLVYLPKQIPHNFKPLTATVTLLLLMTPGGFEAMFRQCSRPAKELALPELNGEKADPAFLSLMKEANEALGVTLLPNF